MAALALLILRHMAVAVEVEQEVLALTGLLVQAAMVERQVQAELLVLLFITLAVVVVELVTEQPD
jgi:hypothetical protein